MPAEVVAVVVVAAVAAAAAGAVVMVVVVVAAAAVVAAPCAGATVRAQAPAVVGSEVGELQSYRAPSLAC